MRNKRGITTYARLTTGGLVILVLPLFGGCGSDATGPDSNVAETSNNLRINKNDALRVLGTVPGFSLVDQSSTSYGTEQLEGHVWIGTFIFTRCTATCPQQTAQFADLQRVLKSKPAWNKLRLISFSVDPEYDTPNVLQQYAERAGADVNSWKFLTGSRNVIWKLCRNGFKLSVQSDLRNSSQPITHSPRYVLVDGQLRIRGYYDALNEKDYRQLMTDVDQLLKPFATQTERVEPDLPWGRTVDAAEIDGDPSRLAYPGEIMDPPWLEERQKAQLATVFQFKVPHNFKFTDRLPESGITFFNKTVDDAGKAYKEVHYDHGNGVAVADVDGNGQLDIYFTTQLGSNELWCNLGDGKFANRTEKAGCAVSDRISVAASFADIDNDGDADLYVTTVRGGNLLLENDGQGNFTDISKVSGLDYVGHSSGAVFFDYNRDGKLDLFLTNVGNYTTEEIGPGGYYVGQKAAFGNHLKPPYSESSILFENLGENRFEDVSEKVKLNETSWSGDASPLDLNEDGWPDLYVLNMQGHDEYYENQGGERFVCKSRQYFPATPWGAMGIGVFDYNNDGRMDIFVTDMHTDMFDTAPFRKYLPDAEKSKLRKSMMPPARFLATDGNHILGNAFYRNDGGGKFAEVSNSVNAENFWPWGLSVGDLNADGYEDAFITCGMNYMFRYAVNSVLLNNRGERFLDSEFILGVEPRRAGRTAKMWFELHTQGADKDHRLSAGREGRIEVWGDLGSRSSAILDLDDDGDLDIVTNDFHSEPMLLFSNLADGNPIRFLKIKLRGSKSNRDGLGAKVIVTTDAQRLTKVYDGKSGYLSQSRMPLYFGLGAAEKVRRIEIQWPSGEDQVIEGRPIATNTLLELKEN